MLTALDAAKRLYPAQRDENWIPPITDPMGKHWNQPDRANILLDATHALMSAQDFAALPNYSHTIPTGVYPGKMWKAQTRNKQWELRWFGIHPTEPEKFCTTNTRIIIVL